MMRPFTIVSLWDVIRLTPEFLLPTLSYLGASIKHMEFGRRELIEMGDQVCHLSPDQMRDFGHCGINIGLAAKAAKLVATQAACQRFLGRRLISPQPQAH